MSVYEGLEMRLDQVLIQYPLPGWRDSIESVAAFIKTSFDNKEINASQCYLLTVRVEIIKNLLSRMKEAEETHMPILKITKATNGYIITPEKDPDIHEVTPLPMVAEEDDVSEHGELFAAQKLFWMLCEELGINTSRKRPHIKILVCDENEKEILEAIEPVQAATEAFEAKKAAKASEPEQEALDRAEFERLLKKFAKEG